jgi:acyl-CoA thioesterase I
MTARHLENAQCRSGYRKRSCLAGQTPLFALLLCLFLLTVTGCAQNTQIPVGQSSSNTAKQTSKGPAIYVAIGASDTFGIGTDEPYSDNWPSDLLHMLGDSHYHLINLGIPDVLIHDVLGLELPVAVDAHPDLVTIWLGVNDIADAVPVSSYARDLDMLLSRLQASSPHVRIVIANIPDLTLLPHFSSYNPQLLHRQIRTYNAAIASAVQRHHILLVNLSQQNYNLQQHPEYISSDGLHPDYIGYLHLAMLFYQVLQSAQK